FIAPVEKTDAGPIRPKIAEASIAPPVARIEPRPRPEPAIALGNMPRTAKPLRWPWFFAGTGAFLLVLVLVLGTSFSDFLGKASSNSRFHVSNSPVPRIRPLTNLSDETSEPAFSPDGSHVAFRRQSSKLDRSGIYLKAIDSDEVMQLTSNPSD